MITNQDRSENSEAEKFFKTLHHPDKSNEMNRFGPCRNNDIHA